MGAQEADTQQCEGSLQAPETQVGRTGTCVKCKVRVDMCTNGVGDPVVMPHEEGEQ